MKTIRENYRVANEQASSLHLDDNSIRNNIKYVLMITRAINKHLEAESGSCRHLLIEVLKEAILEDEK